MNLATCERRASAILVEPRMSRLGVGGWFDRMRTDARQSVRHLTPSPMSVAIAVLSLALGIGANTAIVGVINEAMRQTLPVRDPQRLVRIVWRRRRVHKSHLEALHDPQHDRQQVLDDLLA
jgi:hypothetical protein